MGPWSQTLVDAARPESVAGVLLTAEEDMVSGTDEPGREMPERQERRAAGKLSDGHATDPQRDLAGVLSYNVPGHLAGIIAHLHVTIPFDGPSTSPGTAWPFGRDVVPSSRSGITSGVGNVIWFVVAGWWLAIGHVLTSVPLALTIIGLPMAWANIKMIPVTCFPFGTEVVSARR